MSDAAVTLLGIRHHGPGSARAVAAALERLRPDVVLIEGPPEADAVVGLAADPGMVPPVALLAHAVDDPARAAFWPFAAFSPEWVAVRHALDRGVPVRFIDLPAAYGLAAGAEVPGGTSALDAEAAEAAAAPGIEAPETPEPAGEFALDPIGRLAAAAGHADSESWWEDVVEHRAPSTDPAADVLAPFEAVAEAMTALRERAPVSRRDELREAYMRQAVRAARRAGHARIAVVCGAWHVPALSSMPTVAHDRALLAELPKKLKTEITWVPWTHRRLSQHTGYGAGVDSPGWYHHLFTDGASGERSPEGRCRALAHWMTRVAELLRAEDHPVSSAHVIEAVRLAETLAAMRGRPLAGLAETLDAVRSVMCDGSDLALALVQDRLVVGDALGEVPESAPTVPLQRDLSRLQRSLRLKPEPEPRELDLDLRKATDTARSLLLHRLRLIGVDWGSPARSTVNSTGTFRESWRLRWQPEFAVRIAVAAQWGTTVEAAATGRAVERAARATALPQLTELVEHCLLAGLPAALPAVMRALADRAALDTDVAQLAEALPALVRALRYGDVRGTDSAALEEVARGLADRICVGLPPACVGLDAEQAGVLRGHLESVHAAIGLLETAEPPPPSGPASAPAPTPAADSLTERWTAALRSLARRQPPAQAGAGAGPGAGVPGLLRGRATRLLLDGGRIDSEEAGQRLGLALSHGNQPADTAGWVEGFLAGSGVLLLHDPALLGLLDRWLSGVPAEAFTDVLPLLRRTFAALEAGVRRSLGERVAAGVRSGPGSGTAVGPGSAGPPAELDLDRADAALPVLTLLLGLGGTVAATTSPAGARIPRQTDRRSAG
ncbi:DUF5682 family protein [Kitasatospora sp. NPDC101801]|uniref:DUF5682 family protein n=1 Tax=Kitasatospora sp. NPDC101801 TaxID=3364103 RepID=UPI0038206390